MTTMIDRFFGVHQAIVREGLLTRLSPTAVKLCVALFHESERYCTRRLRLSTAKLKQLTGCSRNALMKARAELVDVGLIRIELNERQEFVIELCDPETGKPWPGDPKQRPPSLTRRVPLANTEGSAGNEKPVSRNERDSAAMTSPTQEPHALRSRDETLAPNLGTIWTDAASDSDLGGTSFHFGHNVHK